MDYKFSEFSLPIKLLILYFGFASFGYLFEFPYINYKIQIPEILFLVFVISFVPAYKKKWFQKLNLIDLALLLFACSQIFSAIMYPQWITISEVLGSIYLCILYVLFSRALAFSKVPVSKILQIGSKIILIVIPIVAVIGWVLYQIGITNHFVYEYKTYPYFGDVVRWKALSYSPNLMLSNLIIGGLFYIGLSRRINYWIISAALIVGFMSLSKELLPGLVIIGILVWGKSTLNYKLTWWKNLLLLFTFLIYTTLSFFVISIQGKQNINVYKTGSVSQEVIWQSGNVSIVPTSYYYLLKGGIKVIQERMPIGCGMGQFHLELEQQMDQGFYPDYISIFEPHDSYVGQVAQTGLLGLLFLLFFFYAIWRTLHNVRIQTNHQNLVFAITLVLIYMSIESWCIGTLHFRHYWVVLAILSGLQIKQVASMDLDFSIKSKLK